MLSLRVLGASAFFLLNGLLASAQATPSENSLEAQENQIEIIGVSERLAKKGRLADVIEKTELIDEKAIEQKQALNLADAIENEPGIKVNNECSMCGMKRVMINGLKGEHTTLLVDGVPMHSVVSSYYGIDAITSAGIEQIEVARGAGASLIAPEAMGGTINIVTKNATKNSLAINAGMHDDGDRQINIVATAISEDKRTGLTAAAQFSEIDQYDGDDNGISESPGMTNQSVMLKIKQEISQNDAIEIKTSLFDSDVFGGPMNTSLVQVLLSEQNGATDAGSFFQNGDVRQTYLGQPWETTETIITNRQELMARWIHEVDFNNHFEWTTSLVDHEQDSYYESFDYANTDRIIFSDFKWTSVQNTDWLTTFGIDARQEKMRSQSKKLAEFQLTDPSILGDSFDYRTQGLYWQNTIYSSNNIEWNFAIRYDQINANWIEQLQQKDELSEKMFSPRFHLRIDHNEQWTSRFSAGRGYRAPLTFFESDHGILEDGFDIRINQLEKANSYNYAISYAGEQLDLTASLAHSDIKHLAFIDTDSFSRATLINSDNRFKVSTFDIVYGYDVTESWQLTGAFEWYVMDDNYKATFGVVPVEERIKFASNYQVNDWEMYFDITWVGSRDLNEYGYADRFNVYLDLNGNNLVDPGELQDAKPTHAKAFTLVNARFTYNINKHYTLFFGAKNLLDFSQVSDMDSPLFWADDNGEPAYDVAHIYGPLRGREIYLGIKLDY